ncbi:MULTISPECIES: ComF family protein [Neisseria]|uniref:ComF family protein n=1 Tax=Neisseria TaxID=482 RepID=UPI001CB6CBED|nr:MULTISPECIES: ComF family protein [Neisseria]
MNFLSCWRRIADAAAVRHCVLCHDSSDVSDGICAGCNTDLASFHTDAANSCPLCFRHIQGGSACGICQKKPPAFDRMWASLHYEPPVSNMIRTLKHLADLGMVRPLANLMVQNPPDWLSDECFDFVLPVPLGKERLLQRGFNQSESIVGLLAQRYGWRTLPRHTVFRRHRPPQSTLKGSDRLKNIKNAFKIRTPIPENCNILLIDDVFTTGATLGELAKMLKKSGANRICCWTLARTPMKK